GLTGSAAADARSSLFSARIPCFFRENREGRAETGTKPTGRTTNTFNGLSGVSLLPPPFRQ
ncbi:hypothetical protein, partial [Methylobacterium frigidaeris]|uniref:hypothetical protein n=1 Tax=Methylobacterium frigidaeris TaxID=2038277 RepID=UPI001A9C998D